MWWLCCVVVLSCDGFVVLLCCHVMALLCCHVMALLCCCVVMWWLCCVVGVEPPFITWPPLAGTSFLSNIFNVQICKKHPFTVFDIHTEVQIFSSGLSLCLALSWRRPTNLCYIFHVSTTWKNTRWTYSITVFHVPQTSGQVKFVDDLYPGQGQLNAALVLSTVAKATIDTVDSTAIQVGHSLCSYISFLRIFFPQCFTFLYYLCVFELNIHMTNIYFSLKKKHTPMDSNWSEKSMH